jgi:hypothetical protein
MAIAHPAPLANTATVTVAISAFGAVPLQRDIAPPALTRFTKNEFWKNLDLSRQQQNV